MRSGRKQAKQLSSVAPRRRGGTRAIHLLAAVAVLSGLAADPAAEPPVADAFPPGEITERVVCRGDPSQSYAVYLPAGYTREKRWPILFAMDPRGRAQIPMQLFQAAAERHGYILVSSYDTRSDGAWDVNAVALKAMLPDTEERFSVDTSRLYLAGFSGTARAGWAFAYGLKGHVAGHIGFGGGLPFGSEPQAGASFAFFGGAGGIDFNYQEMRSLDAALDAVGLPHRFEYWDGPHTWAPEPICSAALDWMEAQAMKAGLAPKDEALLDELLARDLAKARELEESGDRVEALRRYRSVAADFDGLRDATGARANAERLAASKELRRDQAHRRKLAAEEETFKEDRLQRFIVSAREAVPPPPHGKSQADLQINSLKRRAGDEDDPLAALSAQRMLETVFVFTSFYEPRDFLAKGEPDRAITVLRIADAVKPGHPRVCFSLARAYAQLGETGKALDSVACAIEGGVTNAAWFDSDPLLEPLRKEPRYRELLDPLR